MRITSAAAAFEELRFDPAALAAVRERSDELGDLARTFTRMAAEVQARTETLDRLVKERTRELDEKNAALEETLNQIADELQLAQRMQLSILPKRYPELPRLEMYARDARGPRSRRRFLRHLRARRAPRRDRDRATFRARASRRRCSWRCRAPSSSRSRPAAAARPRCLAEVNDMLCEENDAGLFVTVFYGVIDHQRGEPDLRQWRPQPAAT